MDAPFQGSESHESAPGSAPGIDLKQHPDLAEEIRRAHIQGPGDVHKLLVRIRAAWNTPRSTVPSLSQDTPTELLAEGVDAPLEPGEVSEASQNQNAEATAAEETEALTPAQEEKKAQKQLSFEEQLKDVNTIDEAVACMRANVDEHGSFRMNFGMNLPPDEVEKMIRGQNGYDPLEINHYELLRCIQRIQSKEKAAAPEESVAALQEEQEEQEELGAAGTEHEVAPKEEVQENQDTSGTESTLLTNVSEEAAEAEIKTSKESQEALEERFSSELSRASSLEEIAAAVENRAQGEKWFQSDTRDQVHVKTMVNYILLAQEHPEKIDFIYDERVQAAVRRVCEAMKLDKTEENESERAQKSGLQTEEAPASPLEQPAENSARVHILPSQGKNEAAPAPVPLTHPEKVEQYMHARARELTRATSVEDLVNIVQSNPHTLKGIGGNDTYDVLDGQGRIQNVGSVKGMA